MLFWNGFFGGIVQARGQHSEEREKEVQHNMSTLFLQLTQVLMSQIVALALGLPAKKGLVTPRSSLHWFSKHFATLPPLYLHVYTATFSYGLTLFFFFRSFFFLYIFWSTSIFYVPLMGCNYLSSLQE